MSELLDQVDNKVAGELIKSNDWNTLIDAIRNLQTSLNERIDGLEENVTQKLGELDSRLTDLKDQVELQGVDIQQLQELVQPRLREFFRLSLRTGTTRFAIGQLGEITAEVTNLLGEPVSAGDSQLPWIDFVATWGSLKPHEDFRLRSRGGADDRTISVQVNEAGVAKVLLRSDFVEGLSDEEERDVDAVLSTELQPNTSIAQSLLAAKTPLQAQQMAIFTPITLAYDANPGPNQRQHVRTYLDTHFLRNQTLVSTRIDPVFVQRWRDYQSTVFAFAKADADPKTPDYSRGVSSIQVTFRDWILPWLTLDYFATRLMGVLKDNIKAILTPKVTKNFNESLGLLQQEVTELVGGKGTLGKIQHYKAINAALDEVSPGDPPVFLNTLKQTIQDAVEIQQSLEQSQQTGLGVVKPGAAFQVFTGAAGRAGATDAKVTQDLAALQKQLDDLKSNFNRVSTDVGNVKGSLGTLGGRLDATLAEGGQVKVLESSIKNVEQQVQVLSQLDPETLRTKLIEIEGLNNRITNLERR